MEEAKKTKSKKFRGFAIFMWLCGLGPLIVLIIMLQMAKSDIPSYKQLENPPDLQASVIYSEDGVEMGRFWKVNRSSVEYNEISPYVINALIATEDERYMEHSGVDFEGTTRAIAFMGKKGGASTISQQLAKLLYTERAPSKWERLKQKFGENVLATRLEKSYSKEEIITMYLNNFDFLYNAVGIGTAARVYFNKDAKDLSKEEAAMLVGMCKNPGLYNPLKYKVKKYSDKEIADGRRAKDSTRAINRRNTVLNQWLKNSVKKNEAITVQLSKTEFDSLKVKPIEVDYQAVDHKAGLAPYFRETLRKQLTEKLQSKNDDGSFKYAKIDGTPFDIYEDGLKIYTTINSRMQRHAEEAVVQHLRTDLQKEFDKNVKKYSKKVPFANDMTEDQINLVMMRAVKVSDRWQNQKKAGLKDKANLKTFHETVPMKIFSWRGEIDTVMTPYDSIKYHKGIMMASLMSMDPTTGFVKAWVGGPDFNRFAYDHVTSTRQVGSTIKPFVYAAAISMNKVTPCDAFPNIPYCIDIEYLPGKFKSWCPGNAGAKMGGELTPIKCALANSMNNITVKIMDVMGAESGEAAGPQTMARILKDVGINVRKEDVVPSMCLGPMDISLYEMVGAQSTIANKGVYIKPITILRVEDRNGNVIMDVEMETKEAMTEDLAYTMVSLMKNVVSGTSNPHAPGKYYGTAMRLRGSGPYGKIKHPTAGKTGTTQNSSDGWFMGLTPELVTGVWAGADDRGVHFKHSVWGQGARMAMPIYGYYMQRVYGDKKLDISTKDFEMPQGYDKSILNCSKDDGIGIGLGL